MVGEVGAVTIGVEKNRKDKDSGRRTVTREVKNEKGI
jgi:hypothetical protein